MEKDEWTDGRTEQKFAQSFTLCSLLLSLSHYLSLVYVFGTLIMCQNIDVFCNSWTSEASEVYV
jgi:hypothetical protein